MRLPRRVGVVDSTTDLILKIGAAGADVVTFHRDGVSQVRPHSFAGQTLIL